MKGENESRTKKPFSRGGPRLQKAPQNGCVQGHGCRAKLTSATVDRMATQRVSRTVGSGYTGSTFTERPCTVLSPISPLCLVTFNFVRGFVIPSPSSSSSPSPRPSPFLCSQSAVHSFVLTRLPPFVILLAGRPQPGHVVALIVRAVNCADTSFSPSVHGHRLPLSCPCSSLRGALAH